MPKLATECRLSSPRGGKNGGHLVRGRWAMNTYAVRQKKVLARSPRRRGRAAGPNVNVERGLETDHQFRIALVAPLHPGFRHAAPRRAASTTCRTAVITRFGSVLGMSCPLLVAMTCWAPGASAAKASWSSRHTFSCAADRASRMIHRLASRIFADDPPKSTCAGCAMSGRRHLRMLRHSFAQ